MKIQGPNLTKLAAYRAQLQQADPKKKVGREDQLDISKAAKQLQESNKVNTERAERVQNIKSEIKSGQYEINHEKIAQKMIDFWSKHS